MPGNPLASISKRPMSSNFFKIMMGLGVLGGICSFAAGFLLWLPGATAGFSNATLGFVYICWGVLMIFMELEKTRSWIKDLGIWRAHRAIIQFLTGVSLFAPATATFGILPLLLGIIIFLVSVANIATLIFVVDDMDGQSEAGPRASSSSEAPGVVIEEDYDYDNDTTAGYGEADNTQYDEGDYAEGDYADE